MTATCPSERDMRTYHRVKEYLREHGGEPGQWVWFGWSEGRPHVITRDTGDISLIHVMTKCEIDEEVTALYLRGDYNTASRLNEERIAARWPERWLELQREWRTPTEQELSKEK